MNQDTIGDISFTENFGGLPGALELVKGLSEAPKPNEKGRVDFPFPDVPQHNAVRYLFMVSATPTSLSFLLIDA